MSVYLVFSCAPTDVMALMITTPMKLAMRAYSIAVAPDSERTNSRFYPALEGLQAIINASPSETLNRSHLEQLGGLSMFR